MGGQVRGMERYCKWEARSQRANDYARGYGKAIG